MHCSVSYEVCLLHIDSIFSESLLLVTARKVITVESDWIIHHLLIIVDSPFLSEKVAQAITSKNDQLVRTVLLHSPVASNMSIAIIT